MYQSEASKVLNELTDIIEGRQVLKKSADKPSIRNVKWGYANSTPKRVWGEHIETNGSILFDG